MPFHDAIAAAVELHRNPSFAATLRVRALPQGITEVMRIAAQMDKNHADLAVQMGLDPEQLREACILYLHQVLFHPQADDFRVLGLSYGTSAKQLREHRRLLLTWLHPDRNSNRWERGLFCRVTEAASRLASRVAQQSTQDLAPSAAIIPIVAPRSPRRGRSGQSPRRSWLLAAHRERRPPHRSWPRLLVSWAMFAAALLVAAITLVASLDFERSSMIFQTARAATLGLLRW